MRALGCHVFAGGFTMGVREVAEVSAQLEIHDFGRETVEGRLGIEFANRPSWDSWEDSYARDVDLLYGNPRCTGFSCVTSGGDETIHGPFALCTQDIRDLCQYGVRHRIPVIAWESVQQATTTGRPLLDFLRDEYFVPAGYRIAHLLMNAASFGSAQRRKRYLFVAYRDGLKFNAVPPTLPERHVTVRDVIEKYHDLPWVEGQVNKTADYTPDTCRKLGPLDRASIEHMLEGEGLNGMCRKGRTHLLPPEYQRKWEHRFSDLPFSLHCVCRIPYDGTCPTLTGSCSNYVHPVHNRTLTVRELSALMGWPEGVTPIGPNPGAQLAKGICPEIGRWLAEQAHMCLTGEWGHDDWESRWDKKVQAWVGGDASGLPEKTINMTEYAPWPPEVISA
jgi:site-specific DNA-cytosine methylase